MRAFLALPLLAISLPCLAQTSPAPVTAPASVEAVRGTTSATSSAAVDATEDKAVSAEAGNKDKDKDRKKEEDKNKN